MEATLSDTVTYADVEAAAARIEGIAHRTPVATSRTLDDRLGASVFFKCENLQRMGAFKMRGAYNAIAQLTPAERKRGVVAYSSGNHAQAIALASRLLHTSATIVMPNDAPSAKREATEGYGARVVAYDPARETREEIAAALNRESNGTLIPPFDHPHVIAGQGTAARELLQEVGRVDVLVTPCGGGGLLSGSAIAAHALSPGCRVVGVEPEAGDDGVRSFRSGTLQTVHNPRTIADGARTASLGRITFPLIRALVSDMTTVSDAQIVDAMRFLWERMKLVVEPTGAMPLAALLNGRIPCEKGARIGIILSGGNVDLQAAAALFAP
ncbi:MAG TPA: threo-3-hydroxy-L-aspartate ammonia-lyase [Vicinamibacteria bacterium]|nr:threo-3-hydroxy-L-aspartate ammonia-lyase [Vicinamibacteria bacterium]